MKTFGLSILFSLVLFAGCTQNLPSESEGESTIQRAQEVGNTTIDPPQQMPVFPIELSTGWLSQRGDDLAWASPEYDDSAWQSMRVGEPWDDQGLVDYDGYVWLRLSFEIDEGLKTSDDYKKYEALKVILGKIDDVDQTFFNGEAIGQTGSFPDAFSGDWVTTRSYLIPNHLIRWGEKNVLAVRVYDDEGPGGLYEGPYELLASNLGDYVSTEFDLGSGNGVFNEGERLPISLRVVNETSEVLDGEIHWVVKSDESEVLHEESTQITLEKASTTKVVCSGGPSEPGFYNVSFTLETDGGTKSDSMFLGFRPEEMVEPLTREPDFDAFWAGTIQSLAEIDPQFTMTRKPDGDTETHELYEVEMRSLGNVRVRGWYEKPRGEGIFPALLRVPGYTMTMWPTKETKPLAVFSFNIRAHGNSQDDVSGMPQDYWLRGLEDKDGYYYQGAFADCFRAIDFLVSRPEIDANRIAVSGGSQGGGLALAVAGLDGRVIACAPDIPFMCNFARYFKTSDWPEYRDWLAAEPTRSREQAQLTFSYFDAINWVDKITCPVFMGAGLQDDTCPPATVFAMYNRIESPKAYRIYPKAYHWVEASHYVEQRAWLLEKLGVE